MKCDSCGKNIELTFLKKPIGTYLKVKGKRKTVCPQCQQLPKDELLAKL